MPNRPAKKKTVSRVDAERVRQALMTQTYVMRGLTAETLSAAIEAFALGYLRDAALLWQRIKERDDTVIAVSEKRELEASLLDWEILPLDDSPEAKAHKQALEDFYNGLTITHALDQNLRGGVALLIRQMMHSVGHKYAVHEIVWQPAAAGLSAEFRFVPLQFFENRTGRLRFLPLDNAYEGEDLEEGGWMVTVGAGLMLATAIAYLFKSLPLKAWLMFCDKFGMPGLHGETPAAFGSDEWNKFRDALANFGIDWALITSPGAKVTPIEVNTSGTSPHKELVERMDRAISRMWRGADLGTMSQQGDATGSNPQESETDILGAADALIMTETLQQCVDTQVIRYRFGTEPKAYFKLQPKVKVNQELQLKIDEALIKWGVPRGKKDLMERYGRGEPDQGDELATLPAPTPAPGALGLPLANEARATTAALFKADAARQYAPEVLAVLEPFARRLAQIANMPDATQQRAALERYWAAFPELARAAIARVPAAAAILEKVITTAAISGMAEHAAVIKSHTPKPAAA